MGNLLMKSDFSQSTLMDIGVFDTLLDIFIFVFLLITCRCLLKTRRSAPTLTAMSLSFSVIVFIIVFCDIGFNTILLIFATAPAQSFERMTITGQDGLFTLSVMFTALKIYQRFALIILNAFVSINRACAVFMPLHYAKLFKISNTITMLLLVFQLCSPIFIVYAFQLYDCLYFFDPCVFSFYYKNNTCRRVLITVEYVIFGVVHSLSIMVDILVTFYLYKQIKRQRTSRDIMDFSFMVQTLILSFSGGFVTLYLHTVGTYRYRIALLQHQIKLNDLLLASVYTTCIAFYNKRVRKEVMAVLCFCHKINGINWHADTTAFSTARCFHKEVKNFRIMKITRNNTITLKK